MDPFNPGAMPDGSDPNAAQAQKPWGKVPQPQPNPDNGASGGTPVLDGVSGAGDAVIAGADAAGFAGEVAGGAMELAGGALEAAGEVAGAALEGAGGCAEGCGGCSLAVLLLLFATASSAMALFR